MDMQCPNCTGKLVYFRTDHQTAGDREVVLQWSMCNRCRHVALQNWSIDEVAQAASALCGGPGRYNQNS